MPVATAFSTLLSGLPLSSTASFTLVLTCEAVLATACLAFLTILLTLSWAWAAPPASSRQARTATIVFLIVMFAFDVSMCEMC